VIDIDGAIEAKTEKAVLFHDGDKSKAVWLARSQIEIEETGVAGIVTITLPEWLALEKGLI
jgi:hypothetical protein